MFCKHCGSEVPETAQFCTTCGAPMNATGEPLPQVGFVDAIKRFFTQYATFSGRARRSEYWWVMLFLALVTAVLSQIFPEGSVVISVWSLAMFIPQLALSVRRLHDVGKRGTFYLWNLLPIAGSIIVLIQTVKDSQGNNEFGPSPKYR